jgi:hypothetical protein
MHANPRKTRSFRPNFGGGRRAEQAGPRLVLFFSDNLREQIAQPLVMKCHRETGQDDVVGWNNLVA